MPASDFPWKRGNDRDAQISHSRALAVWFKSTYLVSQHVATRHARNKYKPGITTVSHPCSDRRQTISIQL